MKRNDEPYYSRDQYKLASGNHRGIQWVVIHNGLGYRCGYACIPEGHPWYGLGYDKIGNCDDCYCCGQPALDRWKGDVSVHGGLTFGHTDKNGYWIGFNCSHSGDNPDPSLPLDDPKARNYDLSKLGYTIKTTEYCIEQCVGLCNSIADKRERASQ